jgi:uncharacterized protein (TIGR02678 family)
MFDYGEEELEYAKRNEIKPALKECIAQLLERFWVLKDVDEKLYYLIKDNEPALKKYFRETFRYRLIANHYLAKLEKVPVISREWMGEKTLNGTLIFKTQKDYAYFFWLLAYFEGKTPEQQFTLQYICEYFQLNLEEPGEFMWKSYDNRLSLIRVLKYAEKMKLLTVRDQYLEGFSSDDSHDVLLQRSRYSSYFMRQFHDDVNNWSDLGEFEEYLVMENTKIADRKNRYYRRLFLEPTVYHNELDEDELEYVEKYYTHIENNTFRYTDYSFERYKNISLVVKDNVEIGNRYYPAENMIAKMCLLFSNYLYENRISYPMNRQYEIELNSIEVDNILSELKKRHRHRWTKRMKEMQVNTLREELIKELKQWRFVVVKEEDSYLFKEGLFRFIGDYNNTN